MTTFLYVFAAFSLFDVLGRVIWISKDSFPPRTRGMTCIDLVVNLIMLCWAAGLLIGGNQ